MVFSGIYHHILNFSSWVSISFHFPLYWFLCWHFYLPIFIFILFIFIYIIYIYIISIFICIYYFYFCFYMYIYFYCYFYIYFIFHLFLLPFWLHRHSQICHDVQLCLPRVTEVQHRREGSGGSGAGLDPGPNDGPVGQPVEHDALPPAPALSRHGPVPDHE